MSTHDHAPLGGMPVALAPTWTNPNVGMIALIATTMNTFGAEAEPALRAGMRKLGRRTGVSMMEHGLISAGCSPTEWGRFTHQLMDLTGMYDYEEVTATDTVYEFSVPSGKWPYHEPQAYFHATDAVCDVPADWDRGCLEVINPAIEMTQPLCSARGDDVCLWRYELVER